MCFVVFLRILCNNKITDDDLNDAQILIEYFVSSFEKLYGVSSLTFNLHGHLHLTSQVKRFGPLNKISCFQFEGLFKYFRELFHGTRGQVNQISNYFLLNKYIHFKAKICYQSSKNLRLASFYQDYFSGKSTNKNFYRHQKTVNLEYFEDKTKLLFSNLGFVNIYIEIRDTIVYEGIGSYKFCLKKLFSYNCLLYFFSL